MTISSVSSILDNLSSQYTTAETESTEDSNKMDFVKIFLAQLENQDPLNPMDSTDMTSQIAQISTVEELTNSNEKLDTISEELNSLSSAMDLQYIGKEVQIDGNDLTVQNGETLGGVSFSIEETAQVVITISDSEGNEIRQIDLGEAQAGSHQAAWDGKDSDGKTVADGAYTYTLSATNDNGESVSAQSEGRLRITGIGYENGTCYLMSGELKIDFENILAVYDGSV